MPLAILTDPWQRVQVKEEEVSRGINEFYFYLKIMSSYL
jgi:hypothetical protein